MFKKIIIGSLLAVAIFATTACQNNLHNEIKEAEGFIKLYNDLSEIDFDDLEDLASELAELELDKMANEELENADNIKEGYSRFPAEILQLTKSGRNPFSGNRYYVLGYTHEYWEDIKGYGDFDGMDIMYIYGPEYMENLGIIGEDSQEGWKEVKEWGDFLFYVEYIGFSEQDNMHIVKYESHEEYRY